MIVSRHSVDYFRIQTYKEPVRSLKYRKLATKYRWIYGYFYSVPTVESVSAPRTFNLDIALVKLSRPVSLNDNVNVICLPSRQDRFPPGTVCVTAGWGHVVEGQYNPQIRIRYSLDGRRPVATPAAFHVAGLELWSLPNLYQR